MGDDAGDRLADPARADDYAGGGDPAPARHAAVARAPADAGRDVDAGVPDDLLSEGSPLRDGLDDAPALDADAGADDDAHRLARRGTTVDVVDDDDDDDADRRPERARRTSRSRSRERERGRSPPRGRSPSNDQRRERAGDARAADAAHAVVAIATAGAVVAAGGATTAEAAAGPDAPQRPATRLRVSRRTRADDPPRGTRTPRTIVLSLSLSPPGDPPSLRALSLNSCARRAPTVPRTPPPPPRTPRASPATRSTPWTRSDPRAAPSSASASEVDSTKSPNSPGARFARVGRSRRGSRAARVSNPRSRRSRFRATPSARRRVQHAPVATRVGRVRGRVRGGVQVGHGTPPPLVSDVEAVRAIRSTGRFVAITEARGACTTCPAQRRWKRRTAARMDPRRRSRSRWVGPEGPALGILAAVRRRRRPLGILADVRRRRPLATSRIAQARGKDRAPSGPRRRGAATRRAIASGASPNRRRRGIDPPSRRAHSRFLARATVAPPRPRRSAIRTQHRTIGTLASPCGSWTRLGITGWSWARGAPRRSASRRRRGRGSSANPTEPPWFCRARRWRWVSRASRWSDCCASEESRSGGGREGARRPSRLPDRGTGGISGISSAKAPAPAAIFAGN